MSQPQKTSFLQPGAEQIRHQLRGILDSYSHDWDVLAELAQNAIDSITRSQPVRGHVNVVVNSLEGTIEFGDNGTGIDPVELSKLLGPFSTNKSGASNQIGQKGVGLTFIVFSSSTFRIESHHKNGSVVGTVDGARAWLDSTSDDLIDVDEQAVAAAPCGVKIKIKLDQTSHPLFDLDAQQLLFAIRTRTALGNTGHIWQEPLNCDFKFVHVDKSGNIFEIEQDCNYLLPTEGLKPQDFVSLDDYIEWRNEGDRSDAEKRRRLKDKIVFKAGKKYQAGRDLKYWTCFVPNRAVWGKLSEIHGLNEPEDSPSDLSDEMFYSYAFAGGLYTSSKGMPTGIMLELKPKGSAGYVPNFFCLIEDPSLSFDIGRKSIQTRQQGMLREVAYEQFREFLNTVVKYISGSIDDPDPTYDREELFAEIRSLPDLQSGGATAFIKRPNGQEATIAGMFFEQLGKGAFAGFEPYISGYKGRYDLYGKIGNRSFVVEFKFDLAGLFRDFTDERKMFDEVDLVIIWDVTERDRKLAATRGLGLEEISSGVLSGQASRFSGSHYRMNIDGVKSIEILSMRRVVKPSE